ncbi:BLOC-1-related complex subunit 6-like [Hemicordylus capensis]|uniref:BLOC-1-related complex subunit 6-like n=1 Tax=Hemicordylus capensis TaxID=884348 RepID=UPI0023041F7B|nr:BLOC-1-related complex subunit 6-like [Hemicordylus capensis]
MTEETAVEVIPPRPDAVSAVEEQPGTLQSEGTVRWDGRLTHFVANNLEQQIRLSASTDSGCVIPAVDPGALQDLAALAVQMAAQVDELLRSVHGALQALTALSVGCIQTYRDGVEGLGEAVDTSIRSMYTLMARCEELDKEMQPVPALAGRIRDMKSALERLEGLCK